ncbi:MAG: response regulator [Alphaproteobacteria bacterium]
MHRPAPHQFAPVPGPQTVLHIEDDAADCRLLEAVVQGGDWPDPAARPRRLVRASSLKEAYTILDQDAVDAVILDLGLGDSSGVETCARLLHDFPQVPVIVLTGDDGPGRGLEAVRLGAQDFLSKNDISAVGLWRALTFGLERHLARRSLAQALAEKEDAQRAAERASRVKSEFLRLMSHEFRTPLNGIIGLASALEQESGAGHQRDAVSDIRQSGEKILSMLTDILDLLAFESGEATLARETFSAEQVISKIRTKAEAAARDKGIALHITDEARHWPTLVADPGRIGQVLAHLVSNAIKFTDKGRVEIRATLERGEGPDGRVRFDVLDMGPGLPPAVWTRIMDHFGQGDLQDTVPGRSGLGLGLALSNALVTAMGGTLSLETGPEEGAPLEGAHVWFSVPVAITPDHQARRRPPLRSGFTGGVEASVRTGLERIYRILIVEDTAINRHVFDAILRGTDYLYDFSEDGWSALKRVRKRAYSLILMDIQLPGIDGIETAKRIRAQSTLNAHTPMLAVTAFGVAGDQERFLNEGFDGYLPKPVTPESLLTAIERYIHPVTAPSLIET